MKETATQARIPHPTTKNARRKSHVTEKDNPISHGTTRSITKKVGDKMGTSSGPTSRESPCHKNGKLLRKTSGSATTQHASMASGQMPTPRCASRSTRQAYGRKPWLGQRRYDACQSTSRTCPPERGCAFGHRPHHTAGTKGSNRGRNRRTSGRTHDYWRVLGSLLLP